ncbi:F-box protein [Aspergillus mulundensis]|uniref:F-box domain-containing protein n=1 Tax=Aspergillus mulundensis TaxID=1810919 RepID=A0A3D8SL35_9EURO|nr:hypothetical protein DSM5745_03679 [Aspergillus mulundensis]RDW87037.1 hypothetical protein DSM5745_03679 [Aspergillus mulundensis]
MPLTAAEAFSIYEITEQILLQLNDPVEIIRAKCVCRTWRDVIQSSPALRTACWYQVQPYRTTNAETEPGSLPDQQAWSLNPAFNHIGVSVSKHSGDFDLQRRIYHKPGSWATMHATNPPCQRIMVECYDYQGVYDATMLYMVISPKEPLLMGDIMAVLAECQKRQQSGVDRWAGVVHRTGGIVQWRENYLAEYHWGTLEGMPDDNVSVKVAVDLPFGSGTYPAFSLRRVQGIGGNAFLHETIVHEMVMPGGSVYAWGWEYGLEEPE